MIEDTDQDAVARQVNVVLGVAEELRKPRGSQRIVEAEPGKSRKVPVVRPDLGGSILKGDEPDLQIEDPRSLEAQVSGGLRQSFPEPLLRQPDLRAGLQNQSAEKAVGLLGGRRASRAGGMRYHAPELRHAGQRNPPSVGMAARPLNGALGRH